MYEKRLCILRQMKKGFSADGTPLMGAIYLERLGKELLVTPKIAGLSPLREGRYGLAIRIAGREFCLELRGGESLRIPDAPSISNGFSALVCFVRGEAEPVAFGCCGGAKDEPSDLLAVFSRRTPPPEMPREEPEKAPAPLPNAQSEPLEELETCEKKPSGEDDELSPPPYDDEAIASTDYFRREAENGAPEAETADGEEDAVHPFENPRGNLAYYREIAPRLTSAMQKFPRDDTLKAAFPHSQWVKTENGLLGVIYQEGLPRYLCVAMKGEPPEEVQDASLFVPVGPFGDEEGYHVVFQDADTGDYVKVEDV